MNKCTFVVLVVLSFLSGSCMGNADQSIQGSDYKYMVPGKYIKDTESLLLPKSFEADESKSLSLFFADKDSEYFYAQEGFSVSIIIFLDHQYDYSSGLRADSNSILGESERIPCSGWSACYKRKLAGQTTNYYFTFDPEKLDSEPLNSEDYILTVNPAQSLSIGNIKTKGRVVCSYHSVVDGMLLQVSASGDICVEDRIDVLAKGVLNLFHDWKLDAEQS